MKWLSGAVASALVALSIDAAGVPLEWRDAAEHRWAPLPVATNAPAGFATLDPFQTGVRFTNLLAEASIAGNRVLPNGSGVAIGDYDNDGLPDLYLCGLESPNVLYRNLGNWTFRDVTAEAGVACEQTICRGAVFADLNGDGFLDLLVSTLSEGVLCFLNDGRGTFADHTAAAGTRSNYGSMTLALADVDGNGTLDLYVANNRPDDIRDRGRVNIPVVGGKPVIPPLFKDRLTLQNGQLLEYGQPDQLFLNDGQARFRMVSWTNGAFLSEEGQRLSSAPLDWGLTATFRDVNGDLAPDLYVCNDYWTPDRFWINDGRGNFRAVGGLALRQISSSSMGVDFADVDHDGRLDFFVVDMLSRDPRLRKRQDFAERPMASPRGAIDNRPQVMRNTAFRNRGDGTFAEVAHYAGLEASDWSWSAIFTDVDLDGHEDLLISAGHFKDVQDLDAAREIKARQHPWTGFKDEAERQKAYTRELMEHYRLYPHLNMPIVAFRGEGNWRFEERTESWGLNQPGIHHGMALGDLDLDGDLDLVVNSLNRRASLFRNESSGGRVAVKLKGVAPNTQAIGAQVTLIGGAVREQTREIVSGGRYLSGSEPLAVFATGSATGGMTLRIRWRSGEEKEIREVRANCIYEVKETKWPGPALAKNSAQPGASGSESHGGALFKDVSNAIGHSHAEGEFNDFERQPLLPFKLSQLGPGVAWFDLDGDGYDDLVIGAGGGAAPAVFRSDGKGGFARVPTEQVTGVASDWSGLTGWKDESGQAVLLAGITGYEAPTKEGVAGFVWKDGRLVAVEKFASELTSAGVLALGDLQGNGELALFVGGSVVPGRYPVGGPSKIYRRSAGRWQLDARNSALLEHLGIVHSAVWSDLTEDGLPELVLACEWGPVRVFHNRAGLLFDVTAEWGLAPYQGWWRGIAAGDLDGDGKLDLVAANWGSNSPFRASAAKPLKFFYGEMAQPGVVDVIETEYERDGKTLTPTRQFGALVASLPFLFEHFASHRAFSDASLEQVLGERRLLARSVTATTLESMVFFNRGDRFKGVALPFEAQIAPAFGVNIGDFNNDGWEDLFLSQNFFAMRPELSRLDAGRGLLLEGSAGGELSSVEASRSGLEIYGEQRGSALGDFNEDGRVDLVVTQNSAPTKLYVNVGSPSGLRVKLVGPRGNPFGVGAVLRLKGSEGFGPAREIHAGSGYWSQDSFTQVLGGAGKVEAVWIRWPGGKTTSTPVPSGAKEVTIGMEGELIRRR